MIARPASVLPVIDPSFYDSWAIEKLKDPTRDLVLRWKALHLANLYIRQFPNSRPQSICEVGGAEGTVLATVGEILFAPRLDCFEPSVEFCKAGQDRYPQIKFHQCEFDQSSPEYDMVILSDITEHVPDERDLLKTVAAKARCVVLKMPIEVCLANSSFRYWLQGRDKPHQLVFGKGHENGHLRGYSVRLALQTVTQYFKVLNWYGLDPSFYFPGSTRVQALRSLLGVTPMMWIFGGSLFVLGVRR